jgi:hypothetical protein
MQALMGDQPQPARDRIENDRAERGNADHDESKEQGFPKRSIRLRRRHFLLSLRMALKFWR